MAEFRYAQFCPTARAAEILGERWTLLIVRELLCGSQRFSDLRRRLPGISTSVLAERLGRLEERGLAERCETPPPAPAALYSLTEMGQQLRPAMVELVRFGARFMQPPEPGDHLEPDWMRLALPAFSRREATPSRRFEVCVPTPEGELRMHISGGRRGTRVRDGGGAADASLRCSPMVLLALMSGGLAPDAAIAAGTVEVEGDAKALADFSALFDLGELSPLSARPEEPNPGG